MIIDLTISQSASHLPGCIRSDRLYHRAKFAAGYQHPFGHKGPTMSDDGHPKHWTVEFWQDEAGRSLFGKWFQKLPEYDQVVVHATIEHVLVPLGLDICETTWGKSLGGGDKTILLRIFCAFHGTRVILLFQGYDKGKDPSKRKQQSEIKVARRHLKAWKKDG